FSPARAASMIVKMNPALAAAPPARANRSPQERSFVTRDGVTLFYRYWPGTAPTAVLLLHRGHEHSGRVAHLVDELNLPGHSFFAWDARGHGRSAGEQGASTTMATFGA